MADLAKLKTAYEKADEKAGKLTGEYEGKRQKALDQLKERYAERLQKATTEAKDAQTAYMDALALDAIMDRPDAEAVLADLDRNVGTTTEGAKRLRKLYKESK